jgi:hypothetical protein
MISRVSAWVNTVNTTAFRVLVSIALAVEVINFVTIGMLFRGWEPTGMQYKVLIGVAGAILTMMGFDVLQFWAKRSTDSGYVTAKQGPSPVTVGGPSTVNVDATETAAPVVAAPQPDATPVNPVQWKDGKDEGAI